jgi:hypothetical protein
MRIARTVLLLALAGAAAATSPACAVSEEGSSASTTHVSFCFEPGPVAGWRRGEGDRVFVRLEDGRTYRLELDPVCHDLGGGPLTLRAPAPGLICTAQGLAASTASGRCGVRSLYLLSATELAALRTEDRP